MIILTGLAAFALFALLAILVAPAAERPVDRRPYHPIDELPTWALLGRR